MVYIFSCHHNTRFTCGLLKKWGILFPTVFHLFAHKEEHSNKSCELQLKEIVTLIILYWIAGGVAHTTSGSKILILEYFCVNLRAMPPATFQRLCSRSAKTIQQVEERSIREVLIWRSLTNWEKNREYKSCAFLELAIERRHVLKMHIIINCLRRKKHYITNPNLMLNSICNNKV